MPENLEAGGMSCLFPGGRPKNNMTWRGERIGSYRPFSRVDLSLLLVC